MPNRLLTTPPDGGATAAELALAESIATNLATTAEVWELDNPHDPSNPTWRLCQTAPADAVVGGETAEPPRDLLVEASLCDRPLTKNQDDGRTTLAMRLGATSDRFVVADFDLPAERLAESLCLAVAGRHRATRNAVELQEENDSFAEQLSSDLEELTFLRSMVERVSAVRANDELIGMARHTLPVLNETVHARCLALMTLPDPAAPHDATVAYATGEGILPSESLTEIVRRFAGQVSGGPLVRNWEAVGLPSNARADDDRLPGVNSIVLAQVSAGEQRFGWLVAANREPQGDSLANSWQLASDEFGSGEGSLIETTSAILATHAANLDLVREKEQILISVVRSLVSAIEAKDPYTRGHSERVALYTRRLAEEVGYFETEAEAIYLSALLHDVGKIGVSDATLKKEGKLTDEEYAEMSKHPDEGWAILCDLEQLRHVLPGVLHHHERWDGRGYPDGLAGEEIPLDGRVMAVADAYDAMTSDRPYRKGMPTEKAESILRSGAGEQWDPNCVDAFFACLDDLHAIKADYQQRDRRQRVVSRDTDEPLELPHEVAGVSE